MSKNQDDTHKDKIKGDNMTGQVDIQNLSEIKNFIEENNAVLTEAIQALKILSNRIDKQEAVLKEAILQKETPQQVAPQPLPERHYPGYTTPVKYGFMGDNI